MSIEKLFKWAGAPALLLAMACQGNQHPSGETAKDTLQTELKNACDLAAPVNLSYQLPHEVDVNLSVALDYAGIQSNIQPCFDIFSWQSFVALNWPANPDGTPMKESSIKDNPDAMRVWEHYLDPSEVFGGNEQLLPFSGPVKSATGLKGLRMFAKVSHDIEGMLPPAIDQATGQPLIDKNLNFALYEIKINNEEALYITTNQLNTVEGQQGKNINFPAGKNDGPVGAIEIKSTWKILDPAKDDTSKFYKRKAVTYVPASQSQTGKALYLVDWVGLVAMHILHKTEKFPDWIWTTFEHIDNAPEQAEASTAGDNYSFFNPACKDCPQNDTPQFNQFLWAPQKPYAAKYAYQGKYGTQVTRLNPVYGPTDAVNKSWQAALSGSVWANYRLIGSQWAAHPSNTPPRDTIGIPDTLANVTLETYIQNSSCLMTCHKYATDAVDTPSNYSFLLLNAKAAGLLQDKKKKK